MVLYQTYMCTFCRHGNQKAKFVKNIKKINSSEAIWVIKLKLCRNVHSISLYRIFFFFIATAFALWLLWQLRVSIDLNMQWEKWNLALIAVLLQVFWQNFLEVLLAKHKIFMRITLFDLLPNWKAKMLKLFTQVSQCSPWSSGLNFIDIFVGRLYLCSCRQTVPLVLWADSTFGPVGRLYLWSCGQTTFGLVRRLYLWSGSGAVKICAKPRLA